MKYAQVHNEDKKGNKISVVFQLLLKYSYECPNVREYSVFPHEEETLISSFSWWKVTGITQEKSGKHDYTLVSLRSTGHYQKKKLLG